VFVAALFGGGAFAPWCCSCAWCNHWYTMASRYDLQWSIVSYWFVQAPQRCHSMIQNTIRTVAAKCSSHRDTDNAAAPATSIELVLGLDC
jgi:hypothetical protein